ncbi:hypothetical protein PR003_g16469 [Phytophthora rubi]|uniref:Uncharacterized protein n=1 Tax=Phytophthora rubi TaxID=129364 RepID=A0A6A3KYH6_9STRA|nr:hypothetical protein PR002_g15861 [Phytophthora rubi]KAE9325505.1 hypothetical protein PR003_g16469 [Phytophthora rubi]
MFSTDALRTVDLARTDRPQPTDDDKKSSAGHEGDDTSSKKKSAPAPASPKSNVP